MSAREVAQLSITEVRESRLRSGKRRSTVQEMSDESDHEGLKSQVERLELQLQEKVQELEGLRTKVAEANERLDESRRSSDGKIENLERRLEETMVRGELEMLRAVENLRVEHRSTMDKEAKRMKAWISDLRTGHEREQARLRDKIAELQATRTRGAGVDELARGDSAHGVRTTLDSDRTTGGDSGHSVRTTHERDVPTSVESHVPTTSVEPPVPTSVESRVPTSVPTSVEPPVPTSVPTSVESHVPTSVPTSVEPLVPTSVEPPVPTSVPASVEPRVPTSVEPHVSTTSVGRPVSSAVVLGGKAIASPAVTLSTGLSADAAIFAPTTTPPLTLTPSETHPVMSSSVTSSPVTSSMTVPLLTSGTTTPSVISVPSVAHPTGVMEAMTRLMQVQAEAMAAQAKATVVQHLPPLSRFTGEGTDIADDAFDKWVELFKERAKFAGWGSGDQLYHLKTHLDKTALEVYRILPESSKATAEDAISALRSLVG